ncbi:4'-phosphopantetheinyl transferase [Pseudomonadota bacterium]
MHILHNWLGEKYGVTACTVSSRLYAEYELEAQLVKRAIPKRQNEFLAGRFCARAAMAQLGEAPTAIGMGPLREPLWPTGVTGSITHHNGFCAAVAAPADRCSGVGIDLAPNDPTLLEKEAAIVFTGRERDALSPGGPLSCLPRIAWFSAKESVIKVVSSRVGRWIDLREINLYPIPQTEGIGFEARFRSNTGPSLDLLVMGKIMIDYQVVSAAWLPIHGTKLQSQQPNQVAR